MSTTIEYRVGNNSANTTFADLSQPFNDNFIHFDTLPHNAELTHNDSFSFADNICRTVKHLIADSVGFIEQPKFKGCFLFEDSFIIGSVAKRFSDIATSFADANLQFDNPIRFNVKKQPVEQLALNDSFDRTVSYSKVLNDGLAIADILGNSFVRPLNDYICFGDNRLQTFSEVNVSFGDYAGYFNNADMLYLGIKKQPQEKLKLKDKLSRRSVARLEDTLLVADEFNRTANYKRSYAVSVGFNEVLSNHPAKKFSDIFNIEELQKNKSKKKNFDTFGITDGISHKAYFRRTLNESINALDSCIKSVSVQKAEDMSFFDCYIHASNSVISNLYIAEGGMTLQQFLNKVDTIAGYTTFKEFKVGEYEYKDAVVRIAMTASDQVKPTAQEVVLHIDIPDTDDRGSAQITNTTGPTQIGFNKDYYTVPEVQVTLKAASSSAGVIIPSIINITTEYFTVQLMNSNNQLVAGSISWVAKGY